MSTNEPEKIVSITKEELAALPMAHYRGEIEIVDNADAARRAVQRLSQEEIVGFDTETRPSFKKGQMRSVALLQLCGRNKCYLIRLNKVGLTPELVAFLQDENILKVGLSIHDDFHNLQRMCESLHPEGFVELQQYVKQFKIADNSLTKICAVVFGERISKGQRLTNWEASVLTDAQQRYAALDAQACVRLYEHLSAGKFAPESSKYYKEVPNEEA